jgi:hypothetical protein
VELLDKPVLGPPQAMEITSLTGKKNWFDWKLQTQHERA